MNEDTTRLLILAFAANARIEGMKAENAFRQGNGDSITYGEDAFNIEANQLEDLARQVTA